MSVVYFSYARADIIFVLNAEDGQEKGDDAPENSPQYTTVYVGNLALEVSSYLLLESSRKFASLIIAFL